MIVFLERTSGVVKQEVHERPGGNLIGVRMSGVVIWYVHERPALSKITCERMSVWTNIRTPSWGYVQRVKARQTAMSGFRFIISSMTHVSVYNIWDVHLYKLDIYTLNPC